MIREIKPQYDRVRNCFSAELRVRVQTLTVPESATKSEKELAAESARMMIRQSLWGGLVEPIERLHRLALMGNHGHDISKTMKQIRDATDGFIDL